MTKRILPIAFLLWPALAASAQYVGKVSQGEPKKPVLRATAVYEYTGTMTAPNASRLVPVVVWDGINYQPGGLYLAQPEPLAVAPGTQYVLEQSGVPAGLFNLSSAGQLAGAWVGLGKFAPTSSPAPVKKLAASKKLPVLTGGSGKGRAGRSERSDSSESDSGGPVLHRKTGSDTDASTSGSGSGNGSGNSSGSNTSSKPAGSDSSGNGPVLHRRDTDSSSSSSSAPQTDSGTKSSSNAGSSGSGSGDTDDDRPTLHRRDSGSSDAGGSSGSSSGSKPASSPEPDPDRPTLHRSTSDADKGAPAPDADRPMLHRHSDTGETTTSAPDPDRPHLRYGSGDVATRILPVELKETAGGSGVTIGQTVAVSDTETDEPHPYRYTWPSATAQADAQAAVHLLALQALASAARATFGPAAKADAALKQAAAAAQTQSRSQGSAIAHNATGAGANSRAVGGKGATGNRAAASGPSLADPLLEPKFDAFELSYGAGATYVYTAHTEAAGSNRRYVTVIAQPDFYGKLHAVFTQTTRGDMLGQTPALRLIDAVDADGDHRAELLFDERLSNDANPSGRQFALYRVLNGQAEQVYSSQPAAQ